MKLHLRHTYRFIAWIILIVFTWFFLAVIAMHAFAHSVILEDGTEFHFDQFCCDEKDCQEVPLSAIKPKGDGWEVRYIAKDGKLVVDFVREGAVAQRWSPNHQVFACHMPYSQRQDGTYPVRCIYPQRPGM